MKHCDARSVAENIEFCEPVITQLRETHHRDIVQQTSHRSDLSDEWKISKHSNIDDDIEGDDDDDDLEQLS